MIQDVFEKLYKCHNNISNQNIEGKESITVLWDSYFEALNKLRGNDFELIEKDILTEIKLDLRVD